MKRILPFLLLCLLALPAVAQTDTYTDDDDTEVAEQAGRSSRRRGDKAEPADRPVTKNKYNGFSGGMTVHLGYQHGIGSGFLNENKEEADLRSIAYGIGGMARIHLLHHIHVGAEGYVSTMPLKSQGDGSNIRSGWAGALCDYYVTLGRVQLMAGGTLGGGVQRNLHVLEDDNYPFLGDDFRDTWDKFFTFGNHTSTAPATYTRKNFFVFDPYVALEYTVTNRMHLLFKLDYMICSHQREFLTPSGPRLYIGVMFGH